jgi:hypothetical protein
MSSNATYTKTGLSIESEANTVIVVAALNLASPNLIDIKFNDGLVDATKIAEFDYMRQSGSESPRNSHRCAIFDISNSTAASNASISVTAAATNTKELLIYALYTDGFMQSGFANISYGVSLDFNILNENTPNSRTVNIYAMDDTNTGDQIVGPAEINVITQRTPNEYAPANEGFAFAAIQTNDNVSSKKYSVAVRNSDDSGYGTADYFVVYSFQISSQQKPFGNSFKIIDSLSDDTAFAAIFD